MFCTFTVLKGLSFYEQGYKQNWKTLFSVWPKTVSCVLYLQTHAVHFFIAIATICIANSSITYYLQWRKLALERSQKSILQPALFRITVFKTIVLIKRFPKLLFHFHVYIIHQDLVSSTTTVKKSNTYLRLTSCLSNNVLVPLHL